MGRPEFGRDRLPPSVAEEAPAWPPLKTLAVPVIRTVPRRVADDGVSQINLGDGVWHRYGAINGMAYHARCGAVSAVPFGEVLSRTTGQPTCPEPECAP